jgi:hypothetical protein
MTEFECDCKAIAASVLGNCSVQNKKLRELVAFTRARQDDAEYILGRLEGGEGLGTADVRTLFATVRLAYQKDPHSYVERGWGKILLDAIMASLTPELRSNEEALDEEAAKLRDCLLQKLGSHLYDELLSSDDERIGSPAK